MGKDNEAPTSPNGGGGDPLASAETAKAQKPSLI